MRLWAVVPAAGSGARFGVARPKQYECIGARPILWHAVRRVMQAPGLAGVAVGLAPGRLSHDILSDLPVAVYPYIGGAERVHTVLLGLDALTEADPEDWVLVHDAARPCLARTDLERLLAAAGPEGALLGTPVTDTLKRSSDERSVESVPRAGLWRAFTPQLFALGVLRDALTRAVDSGAEITDEASALERQGLRPRLVPGRPDNIKITFAEDLELAAAILHRLEQEGI